MNREKSEKTAKKYAHVIKSQNRRTAKDAVNIDEV
jgi:hypothetical protein